MPALVLPTHPVKKIFFMHIPKCGGMSVLSFFRNIGADIYLEWENNRILPLMRCPTGHMHYELVDRTVRLENFSLSFAIVRNPFERALSDYHWANRNIDPEQWPSFENWINWAISGFYQDPCFLDNHIRPQSHFVGPKISKVFKYESGIDECMRAVLREVGINSAIENIRAKIPHKNKRHEHSEDPFGNFFLGARTSQKFRAFYDKDFQQFYPEFRLGVE